MNADRLATTSDVRFPGSGGAFSTGLILCGVLGLFNAGCGGSASDLPTLGKVSGTVTLDGKPLENAMVKFQPPDGRASEGRTDSGGKYTLRYDNTNYGAKVGHHEVTISTRSDARAEPPTPDGKEGKVIPAQPERVPKKYFTSGTLSADVVAGNNTKDFPLTN